MFSEIILIATGVCFWLERSPGTEAVYRAAVGPALLLLTALLCVVISAALSSSAGRLAPDALLLETTKLCAAGAMVILGALIGRAPGGLRSATNWIVYAGVVYLLLSLWLWRDDPTAVWGFPKGRHADRFTATLFNANAAACICATITLLGFAWLHFSLSRDNGPRLMENWLDAGVASVALVVGIFTILLTASRTTGLALILFGLIQAVLSGDGRSRITRLAVLAVLGGVAFAITLGLGRALTLDRPFTPEDSHVRLAGYQTYWELLRHQPWNGYGLGSFRQLNQTHMQVDDADYLWDLGAAHQPILQAALEAGIPFAAAMVAALGWIVVRIVAGLFGRKDQRELAIGVFLSAVLIIGVAQVDIALNVPGVANLVMLLLGLAWGWSIAKDAESARRARKA